MKTETQTGVMLPRLGHLKLDKERWTLPQGSRRGTALPTPRFRTLASKTERQCISAALSTPPPQTPPAAPQFVVLVTTAPGKYHHLLDIFSV